jgi:U3 small nucleolar RNA-associated protein 21
MVVRLIDIETRKIVRELGGFRGRVLDIVRSSIMAFVMVADLERPPTDFLT